MKKALSLLAAGLVLPAFAAELAYECSFEGGMSGWEAGQGGKMVSIVDDSGSKVLKIEDRSETESVVVRSPYFPVVKGCYKMKLRIKLPAGYGPGVFLNLYDKDRKWLGQGGMLWFASEPKDHDAWMDFEVEAPAYKDETAFARIEVRSDGYVMNTALLDDFSVVKVPAAPLPPPWPAKYKIKPGERERLTAADVLGPDGVVYPDWTRAGVRGGIPSLKGRPSVKVEDFGAVANDGKDDSAAIVKAVASLKDGGVVLFGEGVYNLRSFIRITKDSIVLKGLGPAKSRIVCDYDVPPCGIDFYNLKPGDTIGPRSPVAAVCRPRELPDGSPLSFEKASTGNSSPRLSSEAGLLSVKLSVGGKEFAAFRRSMHSGNSFFLVRSLGEGKLNPPKGPLKIDAVAEYACGSVKRASIDLVYDPAFEYSGPRVSPYGNIFFDGKGKDGAPIPLAKDAARGEMEILLSTDRHGLKAGDLIAVRAAETPARRALTRNSCNWGEFRRYMVFVKAVKGAAIELDQPLRIDFPAADEATVLKIVPIRDCGVEGLGFEQTTDFWTNTVSFADAVDCWAKDVKVVKCGRSPVYFAWDSKFCSIEDCVFDDSWFKGGGGTAYVGWERAYDCLMDRVETFKMRHAPLFQWSASGNVVRNGVFHDSDAQWHSGWTSENLVENCVIDSSTRSNGGYGYGMWASPPEDGSHGPNGPRNVVYNCDVSSIADGVWLGGMNENWIFRYNRFVVGKGCGIFLKTFGFDHIIADNVFVLKDRKSPALVIASPDCSGVEYYGNKLYGGDGRLHAGLLAPSVDRDNKAFPLQDAPRPQAAAPSIYEWQMRNVK